MEPKFKLIKSVLVGGCATARRQEQVAQNFKLIKPVLLVGCGQLAGRNNLQWRKLERS